MIFFLSNRKKYTSTGKRIRYIANVIVPVIPVIEDLTKFWVKPVISADIPSKKEVTCCEEIRSG